MINCACKLEHIKSNNDLLENFLLIRNNCPVLRDILVPDSILDKYLEYAKSKKDLAKHRPILLLAILYDCLFNITKPLHKHLIDHSSNTVLKSLKKQYKNDLIEKWFLQKKVLDRHRKCRIFNSRIAEIHIADYFDSEVYNVINLEAFGSKYDIVIRNQQNEEVAIEVKYIGTKDDIFINNIKALQNKKQGRCFFSSHSALNYLLFRIYESAQQLRSYHSYRNIVIILDQVTYLFIRNELENRWIDWYAPKFFDADDKWDNFINNEKTIKKYGSINLPEAFNELSNIHILKQDSNYQYHNIYQVKYTIGWYNFS